GRLPMPEGRTTRVLEVDAFDFGDPESAPPGDAEAPPRRLDGDALAYMIYTSGSTGRPKGAANPHRAVLNRLLWTQADYPMTPDDRVLQKTPYSFDVSVWELFWPLMTGATLVVARPGGHRDPSYLVSTLASEQVTVLHFVPSMLQVFLDAKGLDALTGVRRVIASGEALPIDLVRRFYQRMPDGAELLNLYGPTEAAIDVTHRRTAADDVKVPIGKPVANTSILVLDRHMEPAGVGMAGELYIGGVQLARGYHARPGLTAERFVPDPFTSDGDGGGGRLYRSGDLARVLPSGDVDYLGRLDHQVKVRGFRIELGEIETAIHEHAALRESVVVAREQRLIAYVVRDESRRADDRGDLDDASLIQSLKASLGERLPDHMVPQTFVVLDALPLSPNGKVDRRALPEPEVDRSTLATDFVAPRNDTEAQIVEIWKDVLGLDQVGALDRFFDLGGHSLLATQVMARVAETFDLDLPLRTLFESPTVAGLADAVLASEVAQADDALLEHLLSEL
ncbi:MAG: non-ribosomal peptide synthetase, partial [Acidobacteriota bacterium]